MQKMQTKNVVIIGAGPAGLSAAIELKKNSNFNVTILEKNREISYKVCAGGISPNLNEIDVLEDITDRKFKKIKIFTSKQSLLIKEKEFVVATVNRKALHEYMAKKAYKLGVDIMFNENIINLKNNTVTTLSGKKINFDYLIGADGSNSSVRKLLGIKTRKNLTAFQYIIPVNYPDIEFHINPDKFGLSYVWIFPQKNVISVGTGYDPNYNDKNFSVMNLRNNFEKWCKKRFSLENAKFEAFSINYDYQGFEFDNIFLVGDAAGFASGFTGEGIKFAVLSGKDVAKKIINQKYECKEIKNILKTKKCGENFVRFLAINKTLSKIIISLCLFLVKTPLGKIMFKRVL